MTSGGGRQAGDVTPSTAERPQARLYRRASMTSGEGRQAGDVMPPTAERSSVGNIDVFECCERALICNTLCAALMRPYVAPPTVVKSAHNSPIINATMILKLVHNRLHLYNHNGVFYFPWHRHQVEGTYGF